LSSVLNPVRKGVSRRSLRRLAPALLCGVVLACIGSPALGAQVSGPPPNRVPYEPPGRNLVLASAAAGRLDWTMFALNRPNHSPREPCVQVSSSVRGSGGVLAGAPSCANVPSGGRMPPLIASSSSRTTRTTVLGLAFSLRVRKLKVEDSDGSRWTVAARRLSQRQSAEINLRPFGFATIVLRGDTCYRKIMGLSGRDTRLFEFRREACV
jgi:hypothetical protein